MTKWKGVEGQGRETRGSDGEGNDTAESEKRECGGGEVKQERKWGGEG